MVEGKSRGEDRKTIEGNALWKMPSAFGKLFTIFFPFIAGKCVRKLWKKGKWCWGEGEETTIRKML